MDSKGPETPLEPRRTLSCDKILKDILSNKLCMQQLLQGYVLEPEVSEQLDYNTLEQLQTEYIDPDTKRAYQGDMLWKLYFKDASQQPIFLFIMLEFQSTIENDMLLRILNYATQCYFRHLRNRYPSNGQFPLPWIIPVVLYTGKRPWSAPTKFRQILPTEIPRGLRDHAISVDLVYKLLETRTLELEDRDIDLARYLFECLKSNSIDKLRENWQNIRELLRKLQLEDLFKSWGQLISMVATRIGTGRDDYIAMDKDNYDEVNPNEVTAMLEPEGELSWRQRTLLEGQIKGHAKGKAEGLAEGEAKERKTLISGVLYNRFPSASQRELDIILSCEDGIKAINAIMNATSLKEVINSL